jgi:hypothetical protein
MFFQNGTHEFQIEMLAYVNKRGVTGLEEESTGQVPATCA